MGVHYMANNYIQYVDFPECHKLVLPLGPVPFCFNELVLSLEASFAASIILISQSREDKRDKIEAREHCEVNEKAEEEVRVILDHLAAQDIALSTIYDNLQELQTKIDANNRT
jgi:uncharacterized membrane protein